MIDFLINYYSILIISSNAPSSGNKHLELKVEDALVYLDQVYLFHFLFHFLFFSKFYFFIGENRIC